MDKSYIDITWVLLCAGLVFVMQLGFLCLEAGMTRSKNAINVAIKNLTDFGITMILYWAIGFGVMFGLTYQGWLGFTNFFAPVSEGGGLARDLFSFSSDVLRNRSHDYLWSRG